MTPHTHTQILAGVLLSLAVASAGPSFGTKCYKQKPCVPGCDGVGGSLAEYDVCGVCDGDGSLCASWETKNALGDALKVSSVLYNDDVIRNTGSPDDAVMTMMAFTRNRTLPSIMPSGALGFFVVTNDMQAEYPELYAQLPETFLNAYVPLAFIVKQYRVPVDGDAIESPTTVPTTTLHGATNSADSVKRARWMQLWGDRAEVSHTQEGYGVLLIGDGVTPVPLPTPFDVTCLPLENSYADLSLAPTESICDVYDPNGIPGVAVANVPTVLFVNQFWNAAPFILRGDIETESEFFAFAQSLSVFGGAAVGDYGPAQVASLYAGNWRFNSTEIPTDECPPAPAA